MEDMCDTMLLKELAQSSAIAQIQFFESVFWVMSDAFKIREVAGIGEGIQIDQPGDMIVVNDVLDDVASDESRTAGEKKMHNSKKLRINLDQENQA
jgi:hypothetical protein